MQPQNRDEPADPNAEDSLPHQNQAPNMQDQQPLVKETKIKDRHLLPVIVLIVVFILAFAGFRLYSHKHTSPTAKNTTSSAVKEQPKQSEAKNYGNKYADGILPVGDKKYTTDSPKQGYIYACAGYARNISTTQNGGAGRRGPWFSSDGTTYDINKKLNVSGSVKWQSSFSDTLSGASRIITTNDLPNHITGTFPVAPSDPAYAYDKNPNAIKSQTIDYQLNSSPNAGTPQCMGGQAGIMLTGVLLFNGFDAEGRDAGAWEVQDSCNGHPEKEGQYHYHTLSSCIADVSSQTVVGFALDGFPITGPKVGDNNIMTTSDLDECHGTTSQITLDGKKVTTYHYVMTQDFPYSVSCFKSTPLQTQPPQQKS